MLLLLDGYLDRDDNIPLEDDDAPCPPPPVESDPVWWPPRPQGYYHRTTSGNSHQSTPGDSSPNIPPSPGLSYKTLSWLTLRSPSGRGPATTSSTSVPSRTQTPARTVQKFEPYFLENLVGSKLGYFQDITLADGSIVQRLTTPRTQSHLWIQDSARFELWRAALESPTAQQFYAIRLEQIDRKSTRLNSSHI